MASLSLRQEQIPFSNSSLRAGYHLARVLFLTISHFTFSSLFLTKDRPYLYDEHTTNIQTGLREWKKGKLEKPDSQAGWKQEGVGSPESPSLGVSEAEWGQVRPRRGSGTNQTPCLAKGRTRQRTRAQKGVRAEKQAGSTLARESEVEGHKDPETRRGLHSPVFSAWPAFSSFSHLLFPVTPACLSRFGSETFCQVLPTPTGGHTHRRSALHPKGSCPHCAPALSNRFRKSP